MFNFNGLSGQAAKDYVALFSLTLIFDNYFIDDSTCCSLFAICYYFLYEIYAHFNTTLKYLFGFSAIKILQFCIKLNKHRNFLKHHLKFFNSFKIVYFINLLLIGNNFLEVAV